MMAPRISSAQHSDQGIRVHTIHEFIVSHTGGGGGGALFACGLLNMNSAIFGVYIPLWWFML